MNSRAALLVLIACGLALASIITRRGEILALSIPFLTYLLVALIQAPGKPALSVSRKTDRSSVLAGESIGVELSLTNLGAGLANLRVEDDLPGSARMVEGGRHRIFSLAAGASATMRYVFQGARGTWAWESVRTVAADPLGLFEIRTPILASGEVVIRPTPLGLPALPFRPRRTLHTSGPVPVPLAGSGTDFLGIREYQPGDALRRINWRLAARHPGRLYTNEHERHEIGDFGLILDARQAEKDVFERAVSAAASLAECILRDGNRLSLLIFGRSMTATFPGYGKRQLSLVLRGLAGSSPSPNVPLDYLEYFPSRLFPRQAVLVMISSPGPRDLEMYSRLRAAGYEILLFSPDPIGTAAGVENNDRRRDPGIRAARIERRVTLLNLSRLGVHIVDWQLQEPIGAALDALAPQRLHRRNLAA